MSQQDELQRFLFETLSVRGCHAQIQQAWQQTIARRDYPAQIRKHLGDAMIGAALLRANLKSPTKLTLQIQPRTQHLDTPMSNDAALSLLVVQVDETGGIRGMAKWQKAPLDALQTQYGDQDIPLREICTNAICAVSLEPQGGQMYQGMVSLDVATMGEALAQYFQHSEQLETSIHTSTSEDAIVGMLLQRIPASASTTALDRETSLSHWQHVKILSDTLQPVELANDTLEDLLSKLFVEEEIRVFAPEPIHFSCRCEAAGMLTMLANFEERAITEMMDDTGKVEVTCEFCGNTQSYDTIDIRAAREQPSEIDNIANHQGSVH